MFSVDRRVLFLAGLERNFNGVEEYLFRELCKEFCGSSCITFDEVSFRLVPEIFINSLNDSVRSGTNLNDSNVRFKLLFDHTADDSVSRLLHSLHRNSKWRLMERKNSQTASMLPMDQLASDVSMFACDMPNAIQFYGSSFPNDDSSKTELLNMIVFAMEKGKSVIIANSASLHASFYDAFNQYYSGNDRARLC